MALAPGFCLGHDEILGPLGAGATNAFAADMTYARRLTGPRTPVGLFAEGVVQWVPPSRVEGQNAAPDCDVGWVMVGAGLRLLDFHLGHRVACEIAIRATRLPLDELGLGERRWGGAGSLRVLILF